MDRSSRRSLTRIALLLVLPATIMPPLPSRADPTTISDCTNFAKAVIANTQNVRAMGGCGFDPKDLSMSTNYSQLFRWCMSVQQDTMGAWLSELTKNTNKCRYCNTNADAVTALAVENASLKCGFSNPDGRWSTDRKAHFDGCMKFSVNVVHFTSHYTLDHVGMIEQFLTPIVGDMAMQIAECRKTHRPPVAVCKTCHETQKPTALLPAALRSGPKRGSSGHDFSVARQPPSIKQGTSSGDSDKAQPSGERRRTPSGGSSTSAMDRLGGGTGGAPSGDRQSGGGSAARPSGGGGGASSAPAGGSSAPNIGTNTIMRPGGTSPGQGQSPGLR